MLRRTFLKSMMSGLGILSFPVVALGKINKTIPFTAPNPLFKRRHILPGEAATYVRCGGDAIRPAFKNQVGESEVWVKSYDIVFTGSTSKEVEDKINDKIANDMRALMLVAAKDSGNLVAPGKVTDIYESMKVWSSHGDLQCVIHDGYLVCVDMRRLKDMLVEVVWHAPEIYHDPNYIRLRIEGRHDEEYYGWSEIGLVCLDTSVLCCGKIKGVVSA